MREGKRRLLKAISVAMVLALTFALPAGGAIAFAAARKDTSAPSRPTGLVAASVGQTSVKLKWNKCTDNVGVTSYAVFMNAAYKTYSKTTGCTVSGLTPGQSYTFYVASQDKAGNISGASKKITVKTAAAKGPVVQNSQSGATGPKIIAGYYASWAAYSGYTPNDIRHRDLTHILYAFAYIDKAYKIAMGDKQVDPKNLAELRAMKKENPALKTLISVGGWEWSGRFSDMAATKSRRQTFADSVAAFLRAQGLDGVDLDWEYPVGGGQPDNAVRAADRTNFTLLLQTLRKTLDEQGAKDGKTYLLTIAGGAGQDYVNNVQLSNLAQYLDFAVVMTYDMHGPQHKYTDLNAPLYPTTGYSPQDVWSVDQAVKAWTGAGFPKSKLVVGVPFYGHRYSNVKGGGQGLFKRYSGYRTVTYDQVVSKYLSDKSYWRYYAAKGRTPCLFNGNTFITYEDAQSLKEKAAYINANGLAGAGIWELSENRDGLLLGTLRQNLK